MTPIDRHEDAHPYGRELAEAYGDFWSNWGDGTAWPAFERLALERVPRARTWLDLCCGSGVFLEYLQTRGFDAWGVDFTYRLLRRARDLAPNAPLVCADVRGLALRGKFDVISCVGDSIHHFLSVDALTDLFRVAHDHLVNDGCFLFDMNTFRQTADGENHLTGSRWHEHDGSRRVNVVYTYDRATRLARWRTQVRLGQSSDTGTADEEVQVLRAHRIGEIRDALRTAGFTFETYDSRTLTRHPPQTAFERTYRCRPRR